MKKEQTDPTAQPQQNSDLAIISMVLGVVSLNGLGFIFGIPAIITAAIALKQKRPGRGLSLTGLITGIVSTVLSLLFIILIIVAVIWGANSPKQLDRPGHQSESFEFRT